MGTQTIALHENVFGNSFDWSPPSLDFGAIPIGSSKSLTLTVSYGPSTTSPELGSYDALVFEPSVFDGLHPNSWTVTFAPTAAGLQSTTLEWSSQNESNACTPQSFNAQGTGTLIGDMGCQLTGASDGTPCGEGKVCGPGPGRCSTELILTGHAVRFVSGSAFSGTVATGTDVLQNSAKMVASIDCDGLQRERSVYGSN